MTKHRINARTDDNQSDIISELRKIPGVSVEPGHDDILVGYNGRTYWIEIKDPAKVLNKNGTMHPSKFKKSQIKLLETWKGHYDIAWTLWDVLNIIGISVKNKNRLCGHCWLKSENNDPSCKCPKD